MSQAHTADHEVSLQFRKRITLAVGIAVFGLIVVGLTRFLSVLQPLHFIVTYLDRIIALELVIFGIPAVEVAIQALKTRYASYYTRPDVMRRSMAIRATLRMIVYSGLGIIVISLLAKNATLAISMGGFTGAIVGFAAQTTLGNAFAGLVLAISHPIKLGDEITVFGQTGKVMDIGAMFTKVDVDENFEMIIPNNVLLGQAIGHRKTGEKS